MLPESQLLSGLLNSGGIVTNFFSIGVPLSEITEQHVSGIKQFKKTKKKRKTKPAILVL
jgi:hypothetical protein